MDYKRFKILNPIVLIRTLVGGDSYFSDAKESDGEVLVMLELWGMQNTSSLPLLPCPLWPRVAAPDRILSMG